MAWNPVIVNYSTDLAVRFDRTPIDRLFFNQRFKTIADALNAISAKIATLEITESEFVQLALDRLDTTLGPMLATVSSAAELGFLVAKAVGTSFSFTSNTVAQFVVTEGAELFTPTPFVLAVDDNDNTNYAIIEQTQWVKATGEFSGQTIFASKTQASNSWTISANGANFQAMADMLTDTVAAAADAAAAVVTINAAMATLEAAIEAIENGAVASVNGQTGIVELDVADIIGLTDALNAKVNTSTYTTGLAGKQASSANLTALSDLTLAANRLLVASGVGALSLLDISAYIQTLMPAIDAATARNTLEVTVSGAINPALLAGTTKEVSGTTYTLIASDLGKRLRFTSATAVTVTMPNDLPANWNCLWEQRGAGAITFTPAAGANRRNRQSHTKSAGLYSQGSLYVDSNAGTAADYTLSGDTAA